MNRRYFLKTGTSGLLVLGACGIKDSKPEPATETTVGDDSLSLPAPDLKNQYAIELHSDMQAGHLLRESQSWPKLKPEQSDFVVVGGGIAGLSAAYALRKKKCMLFELGSDVGGTSGSTEYAGQWLCQGAHYDLAYPSFYGEEALRMLEETGIIYFDTLKNIWNFRDKQFLIASKQESQTLWNGSLRADLMPEGEEKEAFEQLMDSFYGQMKMPTRLIDHELRYLDKLDFKTYLEQTLNKKLSPEFLRALDYQMIDDYGGLAEQVSALAGIHYYSCRPYYKSEVELFSPPEGNYYFVKKIIAQLPHQMLNNQCLVRKITRKGSGFLVEVLDLIKRQVRQVEAKKIVYAGNKHAIPYIFKPDQHLFKQLQSVPWAVLNVVLKNDIKKNAFWQNEILSADTSLMGFVNSRAQQASDGNKQVLTVYFCFKPSERALMQDWHKPDGIKPLVERAIVAISDYYKQDVSNQIEKVFVKLMGHAMPLPAPNYLFNDQNKQRSHQKLVYAGVDNSRLPLLFEAVDSGLMAAKLLKG
ncbi:MAG: FAD-dependent oxidoreductase [Cytophagales bacterium]|nr:MAG: FAD-dependent oxidoreductase [Cytophagales bacterium]TAF59492.1 MAG: FAD-dependent oxidoreductase [Cytophagales bacterium]